MKKYDDLSVAKVHPELGVILTGLGEKLAPHAQFLEGLRRNPGCLNEAEQDVAKTQVGLINTIIGQLGDIRASLIAGSPSKREEYQEHPEEGC